MIAGALFLWLFLFRGQAFSWKRASLCVCASGASLLSALFLVPEKHWLCHGLFLVLLAITWIDVHELWIPDVLTLLVVPFGYLLSDAAWLERCLCGILLGGGFWPLRMLWPGCIGWGDVKLCTAAAFALGVDFLYGLQLGVIAAGGHAGILLIRKRVTLQTRLPFGPWIALSIVLTLCINGCAQRHFLL